MKRVFWGLLVVALIGVGLFATGCGSMYDDNADRTPPTVSSTSPANAVTGVAVNKKLSATFSKLMDPATITTSTFTLKTAGGTAVSGTVTYVGFIATFKPTANLAGSTTYIAKITTGARDLAGNALAVDKSWSFITGAGTDTTAPTVTGTINANGATGVALNTRIGATFSEAMDPATLTTSTFTVKQGTTTVAGAVTYAGVNAVFKPTANLAANTLYDCTLTTGAEDLAGNALAADYVWSWTTGTTVDTTAPTVTLTVPVDLATGVAVNADILATFSRAMDPATINTATFTLTDGTTIIPCDVTYAGNIATLNPTSDLAAGTIYVARVTTGAQDILGNALATDKVWNFTTGSAVPAAGPAPVNMGIASDYVILAKTGIAMMSGPTQIFGNIGVSPAAAAAITGFALTDGDSPLTYSTSTYVSAPGAFAGNTGKVFAADYLGSTPANMTAAISAVEAAYTDAMGRSSAPIVNEGAGLLGGKTLAPGLYTFDTDIIIATDLTLSGNVNDVWIFKTSKAIKLASTAKVILSGAAQANNVFWAAAMNIELGTTSEMVGNMIGQTKIDLLTGAKLTGRLLAQTAVNLQAATVTKP